jgi:hypothetical protein
MTRKPAIVPSLVVRTSATPWARNCLSSVPVKLSSGKTMIEPIRSEPWADAEEAVREAMNLYPRFETVR